MFNAPRSKATLAGLSEPVDLRLGSLRVRQCKPSVETLIALFEDYYGKVGHTILPVKPLNIIADELLASKKLIGLLTLSDAATGFITCAPGVAYPYAGYVMGMELFNTNLKGLLAAKSVILAHRFVIESARRLGIDYATTSCYYKDEKHIMNKILATDGWSSEGYISVYKVD